MNSVCLAALFSLAFQGVSILSQTTLFALDPQARSRLNTCFVVSNFVWGAAGSALASAAYGWGGWTAVAAGGCDATALALAAWLASRGFLKRVQQVDAASG